MKLIEILKDVFEARDMGPSVFGVDIFKRMSTNYDGNTLNSQALECIKEYLIECDEFKNIENFDIIEIPAVEDSTGKIIECKSFKFDHEMKFGKRCYIYSITRTPEIFDPNTMHNPVKDGACIIPAMFDMENLIVKKKICIEFSPEQLQDGNATGDNELKDRLINLFKNILDSPDEYQVKGERGYIIRGIFDEISINGETYTEQFDTLNLDYDNQNFFIACYLETTDVTDDAMTMKLQKRYFPIKMKEKFIEHFPDMSVMSKERLDEFEKTFESENR